MFAARLLAVSSSVFVLVYGALSLAVSCGWRSFWRYSQKFPSRRVADLLYGLRLLPLAAAAAVTMAFTVPSFVLLEPRSIEEPIGTAPLLLGLCGLTLAAFGVCNAIRALTTASRAIASWTSEPTTNESKTTETKLLEMRGPVPVVRISRVVPALTVAGILRPRVLMSGAAEFLLTEKELQTALRHELAHVRRRDNLKKLLLRLVAFPGMNGLEAAWLEATEMAADDAAVHSTSEALDLAAALIKLSRLPAEAPVDLTAALVLVYGPAAAMSARIERLVAWSDERCSDGERSEERHIPSRLSLSAWCAAAASLATLAAFAMTYSALLVRVHTATEWLVR
jgi:beta-lactamase regulating signal transducer with metallopeptidase domain